MRVRLTSMCLAGLLSATCWGAAAGGDAGFIDAIKRGDAIAATAMAKQAVDVNAPEPDGTTALHWAAHFNNQAIVDLLLKAGANPKTSNAYGDSPLFQACANGNGVMVESLLKAGADPNSMLPEGETVLMTASRSGSMVAVKALLDGGAKVNAKEGWRGETALMLAAQENHPDVIGLLLAHGADPAIHSIIWDKEKPATSNGDIRTSQPRGGMTALLLAARDGAVDSVRAFADAGVDLNITDPDGINALVMATMNAHYDVAALLLDRGANPNIADIYGRAVLYTAIDMGNLDWAARPDPKLLTEKHTSRDIAISALTHGADPNAQLKRNVPARGGPPPPMQNNDPNMGAGATPFLRAAKSADLAAMRLLIEKGANPLLNNAANTTALMVAAGAGWQESKTRGEETAALEAIKICLEHGGDVNAVNARGETALHGAAQRGADQIVKFLVDHGAKLDVKTTQGKTPLDTAYGLDRGESAAAGFFPPRPSTVALLKSMGAACGLCTLGGLKNSTQEAIKSGVAEK